MPLRFANGRGRAYDYWRDPLCLLSWVAYVINRQITRHIWATAFHHFFSYHFDDMLLVPSVLPLLLWGYRKLGLRTDDTPPSNAEILGYLIFWSIFFEWFSPLFLKQGVGDFWDVVVYFVGAGYSWIYWRWRYGPPHAQPVNAAATISTP